jgi:hypothetical protein
MLHISLVSGIALFLMQDTSVLSPGIPIILLILMALLTRSYSTMSIYERHPVLFAVCFGLAASKLSIRLVVRVTILPFLFVSWLLIISNKVMVI